MKILLKRIFRLFPIMVTLLWVSCSSDDSADKDLEKPTISVGYPGGFPASCSELVKGETYVFKAMVADNMALASFSLDIHHNFDHHTHDDQGVPCDLEPRKTAVRPFVLMENRSIENGPTSYEINFSLTIPSDIDPGDYHCSFSVTDQTGWQSRTSVDIKIKNP